MAFVRVPFPLSGTSWDAGATTATGGADRRWFLVGVALATFAPWVLLPWLIAGSDDTAVNLRRAAYALGPSHQVLTFALYADPSFRPIMRARARRFYVVPIAVIVGSLVFFSVAPRALVTLSLLVVACWSTFHLSRQNIGVASFVSVSTGASSLEPVQKRLMTIAGAAGVAGVAGYVLDLGDVGLAWLTGPTRAAAVAVTLATVAAAAPIIWRRRADGVATLFFFQGIVFYLPVAFMASRAIVVLGIAHALQYFLFMAYLVFPPASRPSSTHPLVRIRWTQLAVVAAAVTVVGGFGRLLLNRSGVDALVGLSVGLSILHYILDASIWRLRDPLPRSYMAERFPFLDSGSQP